MQGPHRRTDGRLEPRRENRGAMEMVQRLCPLRCPVPSRATGILQSAIRELVLARREGRRPRLSLAQRPHGGAIYADARFYIVIEELRLKDERPGALGQFAPSSAGPFTAESWITVELTHAVGDVPIKPGARSLWGAAPSGTVGTCSTRPPVTAR